MLALAFTVYSALFIYKTSGVIDGRRYFCLADDQMISMRYAENLAHHNGLVWNPGGPPVEGFTNPLWVLYMSAFHLLPVSDRFQSLFIQASGALFLLLGVFFTMRIGKLVSGSNAIALSAGILTGFYYPLVNWCLQGTEVSLLTLIVCLSTWMLLRNRSSCGSSISLFLLLGAATLVRLDMIVFDSVALLFVAFSDRRSGYRNLLIGGCTVAAFIVVQSIFRLYYFGDVLPNTCYLKLIGYPLLARFTRGILADSLFVVELAPFALLLATSRRLSKPRFTRWLLVAIFFAQLFYSAYVGGDAWEWWGGSNRFVAIAMPLFFVLVADSMAFWTRRATLSMHKAGWLSPTEHWPSVLTACSIGCLLISNLPGLYLGPELIRPPTMKNVSGTLPDYAAMLLLMTNPPETNTNIEMIRKALTIRSVTDSDATIAVVWAGIIPYFARRPAIDMLGKTDSRISHEPMHVLPGWRKWLGFWPGHLKFDPNYSVNELRPDVVAQWFVLFPASSASFLSHDYDHADINGQDLYVRRDSRHIRWNLLGKRQ